MLESRILVRHHASESFLQNLDGCAERPRIVDRYCLSLRRLALQCVSEAQKREKSNGALREHAEDHTPNWVR